MKILHSPYNIANQAWYISRAEREKGLVSHVITYYPPAYGIKCDIAIGHPQDPFFKKIVTRIYYSIISIIKYDVFHYYFGRTLLSWNNYPSLLSWLWGLDLKLAKLLKKKIVMTLQGCDVRMASEVEKIYSHSACHKNRCPHYHKCISKIDPKRQWLIHNILPKVDHIFFLNPDLGRYLDPQKSSFLPYGSVPIREVQVTFPKTQGPMKIIHAPSSPLLKGSPLILEALEKLKKKYPLEILIIENTPHEEALKMYREADLIIDQIHIGWYGGFAVEAMAMGKPVACYIREEDFKYIPDKMAQEIPLYHLNPLNLNRSLERILQDQANWKKKGKECRSFVEKWHDPIKLQEIIFQRYLAV